MDSSAHIALTEKYGAHNYHPLNVVIARGEGSWVYDVEGRKYLDMLTAYSAVSFGHSNPRLLKVAHEQLNKLTLTSRAFYNDQLGPFCEALTNLCRMDTVLPMNSGAEAVETAVKASRKWGYDVKGIAPDQAEIIVFKSNFHGRTTTIVSFSSSASARTGFGPFTPGFRQVAFGNSEELEKSITPNTVAVLIEPIQGEGGVIIPPDGFLKRVRDICSGHNVLMVADEVQTGLCRTGRLFACWHENVQPDLFILGKALGGSLVPISAVAGKKTVMEVFTPGIHGSTFGGNPYACAVAREVIALIKEERPEENAARLGSYLLKRLTELKSPAVGAVRGRGLLVGIDIKPEFGPAINFCERLKDYGVLCKDTRDQTMRLAPSLFITKEDLDWALEKVELALTK